MMNCGIPIENQELEGNVLLTPDLSRLNALLKPDFATCPNDRALRERS